MVAGPPRKPTINTMTLSEPLHETDPTTPQRRRGTRLLAIVLAFSLTVSAAVVSAVLFNLNNDPRKNDPDLLGVPAKVVIAPQPLSMEYYRDKMTGCVEEFGAVQQMDYEKYRQNILSPASDCILKVFFEAADRLDIRNIITATTAVVDTTPGLYLVCHGLSHRAAKRAYIVSGENAKMLLEQVPFRTCDDGFVHGIFDAVAHIYGANGREFRDVMQNCVDIGRSPDGEQTGNFNYSTCGDGAGHVLYAQAGGDLMKAIELCGGLQQKEIRRWCVMGAMMETYKPFFATWNDEQVEQVTTDLVKRCKEWPDSLKKQEGLYEGCFSSGGYLFNNMAITRTVQAIEEMYRDDLREVIADGGMLMPETVEEPFRSRIVSVYEDVRTRCELFPSEYHTDCFFIVHSILPVQLRKDKELYNELCTLVLPEKSLAVNCIRTRLWGMGAF
jgi:hypothetical protein